MKNNNIKMKCGGRKSGCCADITLPYGVAPKRIADNSAQQGQAGSTGTQTSK